MMAATDRHPRIKGAGSGHALVVLAAGVGSRYGGLKQLEAVGPSGETLLEYSIFDALRAGFDHIVLVIRPETEGAFRESLGYRLAGRVGIAYVYQEPTNLPDGVSLPSHRSKPWGTGHAVLAVEDAVGGPFAVINADDFYGRDAFRVVAEFLRAEPQRAIPTFALAGFDVGPTLSEAGPVSRGLCCAGRTGWLEEIVEIPELAKTGDGAQYTDGAGTTRSVSPDELVSMNMWGFTPAVFGELRSRFRLFLDHHNGDAQREFLIPDIVQGMIADKKARVKVLRHKGRWCGITFPADRPRAQAFIADLVSEGAYPSQLWG